MTNPLAVSFFIGLGGFAGSLSRYGLSLASQRFSISWPLGTLAANVLGCFAIGLITGFSERGELMSPELRLILATGFCGGFTTMSSMIYETAQMFGDGEYMHAGFYAGGSFVLSMAAFAAGVMIVRTALKTGG